VGIWDTGATSISSCGVAGLRGESPSSRDPVPSSRRPSPAHTALSVKHSSDLQRTPSRGRKATRRRGRQRCGATTDTGNCRQGSQEQLHRPDAGCRIDRRLLRIDRENRRPNCSCVSSRPSWHGRALRRRHLAPSDVVAQRRTVGSERYSRVGLRPPNIIFYITATICRNFGPGQYESSIYPPKDLTNN
jgi:hypothetical protein